MQPAPTIRNMTPSETNLGNQYIKEISVLSGIMTENEPLSARKVVTTEMQYIKRIKSKGENYGS